MKILQYSFEVSLKLSAPVTQHVFQLRCLPAACPSQEILTEQITIEPVCSLTEAADGFGNRILCGRADEPHERFLYRTAGCVRVDPEKRLPVPFGTAAMYRQAGLRTAEDADSAGLIAALRQDWEKRCGTAGSTAHSGTGPECASLCAEAAQFLNDRVRGMLVYAPGTTGTLTTAMDAIRLGSGVCQDFANVYVFLARALGLTARYCMGLASEEGATHAWAEVLFPDGWHGYDPTRGCPVSDFYIRIASGRDSADCPAERGVMNGFADQLQTVDTTVAECGLPQDYEKIRI